MNRYEEITQWLEGCPYVKGFLYFNVVPDDVGSTAVTSETNSGVVEKYLNGAKKVELYFNINIIEDYDKGTSDLNLRAIGIYEKIDQWVEKQNREKNLPKFDNCLVESVEAYYTNPDCYIDTDDTKCRYVARYLVTYIKER